MATLNWIDFSRHNEHTGQNVRAFSVNHPDAGRLVVIKGVESEQADPMEQLGFSRTRDGSWVIRASQLRPTRLQENAFPLLGARAVELDEIDLTEQFVGDLRQRERPSTHPALQWLSHNAASVTETPQLSRYAGNLPSTVATGLWAHLDEIGRGEQQPNGQIHYHGEHDGRHYVIQRRQRLLGGPEQAIYHEAPRPELLPDLNQSAQAPALFRLSDAVAEQLSEVEHYYSHSQGGELANQFTPSRALAERRGQQSINESDLPEGELARAALPVRYPLVIGEHEYADTVSVGRLVEMLGAADTETLLADVPPHSWAVEPETPDAVTRSLNASLYSESLVTRPQMATIAHARGFDALVSYHRDANTAALNEDAFIDGQGVAMQVRMVNPGAARTETAQVLVNQNQLPEGFEVAYGRGERDGQLSLVDTDTGEVVTDNGSAWFNDLASAVAACQMAENRLAQPAPEAQTGPHEWDERPFIEAGLEPDTDNTPADQGPLADHVLAALASINERSEAIAQVAQSAGTDSAFYQKALSHHRSAIIEDLQTLVRHGESERDALNGQPIADVIELGDPVLSELAERLDDLDVALTLQSPANVPEGATLGTAAELRTEPSAPEAPPAQTSEPATEAKPETATEAAADALVQTRLQALRSLAHHKSLSDAGINTDRFARQWTARYDDTVIAEGRTVRPLTRDNLIELMITDPVAGAERSLAQAIAEDEALHAPYQDALDALYQHRVAQVYQAMMDEGFELNEQGTAARHDNGTRIQVVPDQTGAGANVVGVSWQVADRAPERDTFEHTPAEWAQYLAQQAATVSRTEDPVSPGRSTSEAINGEQAEQTPAEPQLTPEPNAGPAQARLLPGAKDTQFMVHLPGPLGEDILPALGGRYIKKYDAYRFKQADERSVRAELNSLHDNGKIQLVDEVRTPIELREGTVLQRRGTRMSVDAITAAPNGEIHVRLSSGPDAVMVYHHNTTAELLEEDYRVQVTNREELRTIGQADADNAEAEPSEPATPSADEDTDPVPEADDEQIKPLYDYQNTTIRANAVERIGFNRDAEAVFADNNGVRLRVTGEEQVIHEAPLSIENGRPVPNPNRQDVFKTREELSAESAPQRSNVVSLFGAGAADEPGAANDGQPTPISGEDDEPTVAEFLEGAELDTGLYHQYLQSYVRLRHAEQREDIDPFTLKHYRDNAEAAYANFATNLSEAGYTPDRDVLARLGERTYEELVGDSALRATVASGAARFMAEKARADNNNVNTEKALQMGQDSATTMPGDYLREQITHAERRQDYAAMALLIAKAYGTHAEIDQAQQEAQHGTPDAQKALAERLNDAYARQRALAELPEKIAQLTHFIDDYHGLSPVPRENAMRERESLLEELAAASYDVDQWPIEQADIDIVQNEPKAFDAFEALADRHGCSVDAARLFESRIMAEISRQRLEEYRARPEVQLGRTIGEQLQRELAEHTEVNLYDDINSPGAEVTVGAGKITVYDPEPAPAEGGYAVTMRYHEPGSNRVVASHDHGEATFVYTGDNPAEAAVRDVLSLYQRYETDTRVGKAPSQGQWRDELDDSERYNDAAVAKRIRQNVKNAIKAGDIPQGVKVSVRKSSGSIHMDLTQIPEDLTLLTPEYREWRREQHTDLWDQPERYTPRARSLISALEGHLDAYNHIGGSLMDDSRHYTYFSHFYVDPNLEQRELAEQGPVTERGVDDAVVLDQLNEQAAYKVMQLAGTGVTYVGDRRVALAFNPGGDHRIESDSATAPERITDRDGLSVDGSQNARAIVRLAYQSVTGAYQLDNLPWAADQAPEPIEQAEPEQPTWLTNLERALDEWGYAERMDRGEQFELELTPYATFGNTLGVQYDGGTVVLSDENGQIARIDATQTPWQLTDYEPDRIGKNTNVLDSHHLTGIKRDRTPTDTAPELRTEHLPADSSRSQVRDSRLSFVSEQGAEPITYPVVITDERHCVGLTADDNGRHKGILASSMISGDSQGLNVVASGHRSRSDALVALARAVEVYASSAFEQNQAASKVETIALVSKLQQEAGDPSYRPALLGDEELALGRQGYDALIEHYRSLVSEGANTTGESPVTTAQWDLPALPLSGDQPGTLRLNEWPSGGYTIRYHVPLRADERPAISRSESVTFDSQAEAITELFRHIADKDPQLLMQAAETILPALQEQTDQLPGQPEALVAQVLDDPEPGAASEPGTDTTEQLLTHTGLDNTHTPSEHGLTHTVALSDMPDMLPVHGYQRHREAEVVWSLNLLQLPHAVRETVRNQARLAGGNADGAAVHFGSLDALDRLTEDTGVPYEIVSQSLADEPVIDTAERQPNLPQEVVQRLHERGHIQTGEANVWATQTTDGAPVQMTFYEGIGGESTTLQMRYADDDVQFERHIIDLPQDVTVEAIEAAVNDELQKEDCEALAQPMPEPSISTINGYQAAQVLMGAGLNPAYDAQAAVWRVNGDTYAHRRMLLALGGKFEPAKRGDSHWVFDYPVTKPLAAAVAGNIDHLVSAETPHEGYTLDLRLNLDESGFEQIVLRDGASEEDAVVLGIFSSLGSARSGILNAIIDTDGPQLARTWQRVHGDGGQLNRGDDSTTGEEPPSTQTVQTPDAGVPDAPTMDTDLTETTQEADDARTSTGHADQAGKPDAKRDHAGNDGQLGSVGNDAGQGEPAPVAGSGRTDGGRSTRSNSRARGSAAGAERQTGSGVLGSSEGGNERSEDGGTGRTLAGAEHRELFRLEPEGPTTNPEKQQHTLQALKTLLKIRREQREPTADERADMARMVGLGAATFNQKNDSAFNHFASPHSHTTNKSIAQTLQRFSSEESEALKGSVLSAFYTPPAIRDFMWRGLERMGLSDQMPRLNVKEPAAGIGAFIGAAPDYVRNGAKITAIECEPISAEITGLLYPEARVIPQQYQNVLAPANSTDLTIGNPPYSDVRTYNPNTGKREVLHDLFLRESIRETRPGGVVAFVTSSGTMDKAGDSLRQWVYSHADLVGGYRLPNDAFAQHAGTEVMTDVLYFRVRKPGEQALSDDWVYCDAQSFEFKDEPHELNVNRYFANRPERVLGTLEAQSGPFGPRLGCQSTPGVSLDEQLSDALQSLPREAFDPTASPRQKRQAALGPVQTAEEVDEQTAKNLRIGSFFVNGQGEVRVLDYDGDEGRYTSDLASLKTRNIGLAKDYITLRDSVKALVEAESEPEGDVSEEALSELRQAANTHYETFVQRHGPINRKSTMRLLRLDPDIFTTSQVESYDKDADRAEKADILHKRVIQAEKRATINTPFDAAYASMSRFGHIDQVFVEQQLGRRWEEIEPEFGDHVFFDPETGHHTLASVYLSGDVVHKREVAERALITQPELDRNIAALKEATPTPIPITDIHIKMGATWMPESLITGFMRHALDAESFEKKEKCYVKWNELTGERDIRITKMVMRDARIQNEQTFGTKRVPFEKILRHCLNQTHPKVYDKDWDGNSVLNDAETQAARDKQTEVEEAFVGWVTGDNERTQALQDAYNYRLNRFVRHQPEGAHLDFPGLASEFRGKPFQLGDHQLGVVERTITDPFGTLIAHEAGAGKSISMTCAAIKNKQLGLANKPLVAVPNHMLVQFTKSALETYPNARILTVSKDDLTPDGRHKFANKVRMNDWDAVICTHEQFSRMKMPLEYHERVIQHELSEMEEMLLDSDNPKTTKQLEKQKKSLKENLTAVHAKIDDGTDDIDFTELGIDWVAYDEGHYLKNKAFPTRNSDLAGVQTKTTKRSLDAEMKFDWIRESRGDDKGVVLATGTPISNTIGEVMVMMRYLAPKLLERAGIRSFDDFIATFGETVTHTELTADGGSYQLKERLSRFHNIPELMRLFTQVADIKMGDDINLTRPSENRVTNVTEMGPEQRLFMDYLAERAQRVKNGGVKSTKDNMLKIFIDLGKMSIDPRLYHHKLPDNPESKINQQIKEALQSWEDNADTRSTQIMFLDNYRAREKVPNGTDKHGDQKFKTEVRLNLCDDIKDKFVKGGVPKEQIAVIHDYKTDDEKERLFDDVRSGKVRIVLASTEKMGVGTDVQTRLKDIHHLSYPLRSIDIEQRNKRAIRQGNMHDTVNIHFPTTRDSGDLSRLQMIQRKEEMTSGIMRCDFENMTRSMDEEIQPSYEDIMAITTGNELIKDKLETDTAVETLRRKQKAHQSAAINARSEAHIKDIYTIPNLEDAIRSSEALRDKAEPETKGQFAMVVNGKHCDKAKNAGALIHSEANKMRVSERQKSIGSYRGFDLLLTKSEQGQTYLTLDAPVQRISTPLSSEKLWTTPNKLAALTRKRIEKFDDYHDALEREQEKLAEYQKVIEAPFPHQQELEDALKRQSELNVAVAEDEKERHKNAPEREAGDLHPFEQLIAKLDGENIEPDAGTLSDEQIQQALEDDEPEHGERETERSNGPNLELI